MAGRGPGSELAQKQLELCTLRVMNIPMTLKKNTNKKEVHSVDLLHAQEALPAGATLVEDESGGKVWELKWVTVPRGTPPPALLSASTALAIPAAMDFSQPTSCLVGKQKTFAPPDCAETVKAIGSMARLSSMTRR